MRLPLWLSVKISGGIDKILGRIKKEDIKDEEKKIKERNDGEKGIYVRSTQVETDFVGDGREKDRYERNIVISKLEKGENAKGVDRDIIMQDEYNIIALGNQTEGNKRKGCVDEESKDDNDREENVNNTYDKRPKSGDHMSSSGNNRKTGVHRRRKREGRVADEDARNKDLHINEYEGEAKVDTVDQEKKDIGAEKGRRENGENSSQHTNPNEKIKEDETQDKTNRNMTSIDIYDRNADEDKKKYEEKNRTCVEKRNVVLGAGALSLPVKVPVTSIHFRPNDKTTYILGTASGEVLLVGDLRAQFLFIILEDYRSLSSMSEIEGFAVTKKKKKLLHCANKTNQWLSKVQSHPQPH